MLFDSTSLMTTCTITWFPFSTHEYNHDHEHQTVSSRSTLGIDDYAYCMPTSTLEQF